MRIFERWWLKLPVAVATGFIVLMVKDFLLDVLSTWFGGAMVDLIIQQPALLFFVPFVAVALVNLWIVANTPTWDDVEFTQWVPNIKDNILAGIRLVNTKGKPLQECRAEVIRLTPALPTGQPLPISQAYEDFFPLTLCWIKDGMPVCTPIDIPPKTEAFVGLVYLENVDGEHWYTLRGANEARLIGAFTHVCYTQVRLTGKVDGKSIAEPKYLLISTALDGKRVATMEVAEMKKPKKKPVKEQVVTKDDFLKTLNKIIAAKKPDGKHSDEGTKGTSE